MQGIGIALGWLFVGMLVVLSIGIVLFRTIIIPLNVNKRRVYARYVYEEEVLANETVRHEDEYISIRGRTLYRQTWSPVGKPIKAVILFIHGLNAYSGKFAQWVPTFTEQGICIVGIDHYGHGRSDGLHGFIPSVEQLVDDVQQHLVHIREREEFKNIPLFTMGMSLGGLVQLRHSIKCIF